MVDTVSEVAKLLANGIDRAAQFEIRTRQSKALHSLVGMAESSPRTIPAALALVAQRCLTIIPSNVCVVELTEAESRGEDVVGVAMAHSDHGRLPDQARETGTTTRAVVRDLVKNWESRLETLSEPIRLAGRLVGTVTCHRHSRFDSDDRLLLEAVTNYAALVVTGVTTTGPSPCDELIRGKDPARAEQLLTGLGWAPKSLATPFVVQIDPGRELPGHQALLNATRVVESALHTRDRRPIPDVPGTVAGLALGAISDRASQAAVACDLEEALAASGLRADLVVGWGGSSAVATGIVEGLREAREAASWAALIRPDGRSITYQENSLLRILAEAGHDRRDDLGRARRELAQLDKLDNETGSPSIETLRAYVENHGSAADAAKQLFIHRNTMRQRLDKLRRALSLPLDTPDGWLITRLALLIHDGGGPLLEPGQVLRPMATSLQRQSSSRHGPD
jgi:hypothetical protein